MATHSSVLAWRFPGTEEPGGLPSAGSHRVGHDWSDLAAAAKTLGRSSHSPSFCNSWEAMSAGSFSRYPFFFPYSAWISPTRSQSLSWRAGWRTCTWWNDLKEGPQGVWVPAPLSLLWLMWFSTSPPCRSWKLSEELQRMPCSADRPSHPRCKVAAPCPLRNRISHTSHRAILCRPFA